MRVQNKSLWIVLFLAPCVLLFGLIYLTPLTMIVYTSFMQWDGFSAMKWVGFANYKEIFFEDSTFHAAFVNTVKWALLATFVHVPFGVMMAMILFKKPFGWKFVRAVSLVPNIISSAAMAILYVFIFNPGIGLINKFVQWLGFKDFQVNWFFEPTTAFIAVSLTWVLFTGVIILITMAELSAIPPSIHDAARIDGASELQIDLRINLPMIRGVIGVGVILAVTSSFKKFETIFLTTSGGPGDSTTNIAMMIYNQVVNSYRNGYANALGTILLVLGIIVILVVNKAFKLDKKIGD